MKIETEIVACIYEGSAEKEILKVLLDAQKLIFSWENLLEGELIHTRSGKQFEKKHLSKSFKEKITVVRILDSRGENFNISKAYRDKIEVVNIVTAPEIEMLVIVDQGEYDNYSKVKSRMKPSEYCTNNLKMPKIKNKDYISEYFSDVDKLVSAIKEYKRVSNIPKGENCLADLLK